MNGSLMGVTVLTRAVSTPLLGNEVARHGVKPLPGTQGGKGTYSFSLAVKQGELSSKPWIGTAGIWLDSAWHPVAVHLNSLPALPQFSHSRNGTNVGARHASDVVCTKSKSTCQKQCHTKAHRLFLVLL